MGPSPEKIKAQQLRMEKLGVSDKDIEIKFIKASGRGGQKVNKTSSAVFVKHTTTGMSAKCSTSRSQHLNRFLAIRRLLDKIEGKTEAGQDKNAERVRKIQKQKKRRKAKSRKKRSSENE